MERLSVLIEETVKELKGVSLEARGLYLTLYLMACQKTGDGIESGEVKLYDDEPTPEILSALLKKTTRETNELRRELEKAGLLKASPLRITNFKRDNDPYLSIRKSNRARKGMKYKRISGEIQPSPEGDGTGKDKKGLDRTGKVSGVKLLKDLIPKLGRGK